MAIQIELNFDAGLVDQFPNFLDCVRASVYGCGKPFKVIAADLDMSSSRLSRMLNEADPNLNFPLHRLPDLIQATGDDTPIRWLVEKFCEDPEAKRKRVVAELSKTLGKVQALLQQAGAA